MRALKLIFYICCNPGIEIFNKFPAQPICTLTPAQTSSALQLKSLLFPD